MTYQPFPQARWTLVLAAKEGEDQGPSGALEQLVGAYWQPIFGFLRGRSSSQEEARDQAQGFFAYILEWEFLKNIEPEGGRFRNFLLVSLRRWLKDERLRVVNAKRESWKFPRRSGMKMQRWSNRRYLLQSKPLTGSGREHLFSGPWPQWKCSGRPARRSSPLYA